MRVFYLLQGELREDIPGKPVFLREMVNGDFRLDDWSKRTKRLYTNGIYCFWVTSTTEEHTHMKTILLLHGIPV